jgi:hypothetical protein
MKNNKFALQVICFGLVIISFVACDKDFTTLESDIINNQNATNFNIVTNQYDIITYNKVLGPVQTNNLGLNTLGYFNDAYGSTTAEFVTQLSPTSFAPSFGENVVLDSVVLSLPFFGSITEIDEDGNISYQLDSVIGSSPIKLSIYESNYFLRDFNPNADFNEIQPYYSNKSTSNSEMISTAVLEGEELILIQNPDEEGHISLDNNGNALINNSGFILTTIDDEGETQVTQRQPPGLRLKLDPQFWQEKIIDQEENAVLTNQNNFSEYFRGLYFKAEAVNDDGSFMILNVGSTNSNIIMYYTRDSNDEDDEDGIEQATYTINFGPNRVNFIDNDFNVSLTDGDPINGDQRLYLKGGQGSIARISLFNGEDIDIEDEALNAFELWKSTFVETDDEGNFVKSKRIVNEANLVFYVDQNSLDGKEPNRIYLYDIENKTPLVDYFLDGQNNTVPSISVSNHLGPLQRVDDEPNGEGIKYKLLITEHINNLLLRDSTNVDLGLSVSLNVNLEELLPQRDVLTTEDTDDTTPISSIITPRGTVLHGNNTEDETKRVYLEIYYTEPNN